MAAFTCQVHQIDKAPKKIQLFGDKTKKIEAAQHVIEFPGGAIEVSRTADGNYWAHIILNRDVALDDCEGLMSAVGSVVDSRIDTNKGILTIPEHDNMTQIAVLIKATR